MFQVHVSLDASEIQTTEQCVGCGKVSEEKAPELRRRQGRIRKVIEQAVANLGEHAGIASIAIDRGFMDGTLLRWLNTQDIIFYIPAKSNMAVYENTRAGFQSHVYLTVLIMALTTAFQTWMEQQDKLENTGEETGIRKFRELVREENGNQLIIFNKDRYAIFQAYEVYEVFILCGRNVVSPNGVPERITREDILRKYRALIE